LSAATPSTTAITAMRRLRTGRVGRWTWHFTWFQSCFIRGAADRLRLELVIVQPFPFLKVLDRESKLGRGLRCRFQHQNDSFDGVRVACKKIAQDEPTKSSLLIKDGNVE